jgi:hypothetical protein
MKKTIVLLVFTLIGSSLFAQQYHWRLTYEVSIPLGEFSDDYISATSWRGIGVDNRWQINDRLTAGIYVNWLTFYEKKSQILASNESGTISAFGNQFRYLNTWTFQGNVHYYLSEQGQINPWVGLGLGTAYSVQRTELGLLAFIYEPWSFTLSPQIGVDIPISISTDFTLGVRYNWYLNSENKAPLDYTFIGINAGFKFTPF